MAQKYTYTEDQEFYEDPEFHGDEESTLKIKSKEHHGGNSKKVQVGRSTARIPAKTKVTNNQRSNMKKAEFISAIDANLKGEFTQEAIQKMLAATNEVLVSVLQAGEKISVLDLGQMEVKQRAERIGRNPKTGEAITIPAANVVKFTAGKALKEAVNKA